ncbi:4'-phosphopantetheinyl transferase family protein [Photobacterium sanguinicancri]|uniref:4'-phosphopantetheinyl transferase family protein n=1 Tax=Photobacterium sanguinicancri TaxID=875932 RepID=UPI0021C4419E|nr:4'-phosphopantetheinyl transferase superfamily protein [Photobacterium sanguinicancri]
MDCSELTKVNTVDLWFLTLPKPHKNIEDLSSTVAIDHSYLINQARPLLNEEELAKAMRYRQPLARMHAIYIRAFLRVTLSRYARVRPNEWCFEYGEKGKPYLCRAQRQQTSLVFNLSHSGDQVLLAVTQTADQKIELGVDIESEREDLSFNTIMDNYFQPQEIESLMRLDLADQRRRFFDLWVLKESYIKATGLGLAQPLKSFGFGFSSSKKQHLSLFDEKQVSAQPLELITGIVLNTLNDKAAKDEDWSKQAEGQMWSTCLGRLSSSYRFGLMVKGRKLDISSIYARKVSIENLLNR